MIKDIMAKILIILFLLVPMSFFGCSGGSGDSTVLSAEPVTSSQAIEILPSSYDFGIVTPGNSPAPLEIEIINNGSGALNVQDISFLVTETNFILDLSGGTNPCNTASSTIASGSSCSTEVTFQPTSDGSFETNLTISSNDPVAPEVDVLLSGVREPISNITVRINQVETCPGPVVTAYVSVTDQGGYPVRGLELDVNNFTVTEAGGYEGPPDDPVEFVKDTATISVALVMDYSSSITDVKDNVDDMEESAANFVDQLGAGDEAEIVKFDTEFEVVQDYTSDKDALTAAIYAVWDKGDDTLFYDAVWQAVNDTAGRNNVRKAVIVISDGIDVGPSSNSLDDVIDHAKENGIPIFTVGLAQINSTILQQMADDTGGGFYEATTSDNLRTIYQQLADVLYHDQYILTYTSGLGSGVTADLKIGANYQGIVGDDTKSITSCQ